MRNGDVPRTLTTQSFGGPAGGNAPSKWRADFAGHHHDAKPKAHLPIGWLDGGRRSHPALELLSSIPHPDTTDLYPGYIHEQDIIR